MKNKFFSFCLTPTYRPLYRVMKVFMPRDLRKMSEENFQIEWPKNLHERGFYPQIFRVLVTEYSYFFMETVCFPKSQNLEMNSFRWGNGYFLYARQENCEWFLLAETNDPLDQRGAVRHRVGPKDHEFQLKKSWTCFDLA